MSGRILPDSNIIIYLSKGELGRIKLFDDKKKYFISVITYMETLDFQFETLREKEFVYLQRKGGQRFAYAHPTVYLHLIIKLLLILNNRRDGQNATSTHFR